MTPPASVILQNKQSENITSLAELTSTATFLKFLLARFTLDKAGSPRREPFRIVLQKFFTGLVSTSTSTICGDACPLSCASAEAYRLQVGPMHEMGKLINAALLSLLMRRV